MVGVAPMAEGTPLCGQAQAPCWRVWPRGGGYTPVLVGAGPVAAGAALLGPLFPVLGAEGATRGWEAVLSRPRAGSERGLPRGQGVSAALNSSAPSPTAGTAGPCSSRPEPDPTDTGLWLALWRRSLYPRPAELRHYTWHRSPAPGGRRGRMACVGVWRCVRVCPHPGLSPCPGCFCAWWTTSCWSPLT